MTGADAAALDALSRHSCCRSTSYIPLWVKLAVAVALGLGTMIGWQRIVRTIGEKIGKSQLSYAQGASAELVTMLTIGARRRGRRAGQHHPHPLLRRGRRDVRQPFGPAAATLRNIVLAWVSDPAGLHAAGLAAVCRQPVYAFLRLFG